MASIHFEGDIDKDEDVYVLAYVELLFGGGKDAVTITRIPEETKQQNILRPDYFIELDGQLLEVKEIHDVEHTEQWSAWGKKITAIKDAIKSLGDLADVNGTYLVSVPEVFGFSKSPKKQLSAARKISEAINTGQKYVDVFDARFTIKKISDDENLISFSNISEGRTLNPAGTVADGMKSGITKANQQLNSPPDGITVQVRKVLFINKYIFTLRDWELFNAASYAYSEFDSSQFVDEVWVQYRDDEDNFQHKRVYNRKFFEEFNNGNVQGWNEADYELFADWFTHIFEWSDEYKEKLLATLKILLTSKRPYELFKSALNRTEMIKLGNWLCENKRYDEAAWLVEQFIDDPNDVTDDSGKNFADKLSESIKAGEEVVQISTVLGQLGWLVNLLNPSKDHINKTADFTIKLLENDNLYVKSLTMLSLKELIRRQEWLKEYDTVNGTDYFNKLRQLTFELMREFGEYLTIANMLSTAFYYLLDLTEDETVEVLQKLKTGKNIGWLYIYYSFFRAEQTADFGEYDSSPAHAQLAAVISGEAKADDDRVADITWRIWKYLKEHPDDFEKFLPTLEQIAARPYSRANYSIEHIIGDWSENKPNECITLFTSLIDSMVAVSGEEEIVGRMWISSEAMLPVIARTKPDTFIEVLDKLMVLWDNGTMIGHPSAVLSSYQYIENEELRNHAKTRSIEHYEHMKSVQPRIEAVEFP